MSESVGHKLERAHRWFNEHCPAVFEKLHDYDREGGLEALAGVEAELQITDELPVELKEYLAVRLRYVRWQAERLDRSPQEIEPLQAALLAELAVPVPNELATGARRSYLIQLRTMMLRDGEADYPPAEFKAHYAAIPPELHTSELDLYVASWGYLARDVEVLAEILEDYTVNPGVYQTSFVWQAINLMYQLVTTKASARDVAEMLRALQHLRHWQFVEKLLWRECSDLGLVDEHNEQRLAEKLEELGATDRPFTQIERRTKRMRSE